MEKSLIWHVLICWVLLLFLCFSSWLPWAPASSLIERFIFCGVFVSSKPLDPSCGDTSGIRCAWGLASHPSQPFLLSCLPQSKRCCCCLGSLEESSDLYTWKITRWLKRGQSYSLSSVREEWVMGNDRCCNQNQRLYYSLIGIPPHVREILGCASLPLCSVGKCWIDLSAQNIGA